jgi:hypothetical protein
VIVGLLGIGVVLWLLRGALDPEPPAASTVRASVATRSGSSAAMPTTPAMPASQPAVPELPPAPEPPPLRGHDTVDPCTAGWEPAIPAGYDTVIADGITVAWLPGELTNPGPYDVALKPTAIAYLVNGLLEEAAQLTGTPRRERLTVIVDPSRESFLARSGAPAWSDGVYDGGAVRLEARPSAELGVQLPTLRHELMHAQLHATVGCMPSWLNEGLAMYFAGPPPIRPWLGMLRSPDAFDLTALEVPSLAAMPDDRAERAYAQSLAMIVFIVERTGEPGVRAAVGALKTLSRESPRGGMDLWEHLYPGAGNGVVLDALAHKIFGVTPGSELARIFQGAICCHGLRAVNELGCRGAPLRPDKTSWLDQTSSPRAVCSATW